ncbi:hypothetical protein Bbelb_446040 [Branchiostoma belcheri]|nr:hypothetical protein Bbelb_446040 [Branchiostoma belcheri]
MHCSGAVFLDEPNELRWSFIAQHTSSHPKLTQILSGIILLLAYSLTVLSFRTTLMETWHYRLCEGHPFITTRLFVVILAEIVGFNETVVGGGLGIIPEKVTCPKWRRIYPEGGHESDGLVARCYAARQDMSGSSGATDARTIQRRVLIAGYDVRSSFRIRFGLKLLVGCYHSITVRKSPTDPPTNSFVASVTVHPATRGITHNHVSCNRKYMEVAHHQIGMPPLKRTGDNVTLMGEERPPGTLQAEVDGDTGILTIENISTENTAEINNSHSDLAVYLLCRVVTCCCEGLNRLSLTLKMREWRWGLAQGGGDWGRGQDQLGCEPGTSLKEFSQTLSASRIPCSLWNFPFCQVCI